jgi:hypothetical protein
MNSLLLVGELMKLLEHNFGLEETLGVLTGEKMDTSESRWVRIILESKKTAVGVCQNLLIELLQLLSR